VVKIMFKQTKQVKKLIRYKSKTKQSKAMDYIMSKNRMCTGKEQKIKGNDT